MRDELCELFTEVLDVRVNDLEEKECLCLLWESSQPVPNKGNPRRQAERGSQYVTLDVPKIQRRRVGSSHCKAYEIYFACLIVFQTGQ